MPQFHNYGILGLKSIIQLLDKREILTKIMLLLLFTTLNQSQKTLKPESKQSVK